MSGVSRNSKKFYSVRPCQLYDLNTNVRLMIMKNQQHRMSRTTMRNESVPEPFKEQIAIHIQCSQTPRINTATHQKHHPYMLYAKEILKNNNGRKNCPINTNA